MLTEHEKEQARLFRIWKRNHDCVEYLDYDGGVARCARCETSAGELLREAYALAGKEADDEYVA